MKNLDGKLDVDLIQSSDGIALFDNDDSISGFASHFTTTKKAARILGVTEPTLRRYVKLGFITRYEVGRRKYFRIDDLYAAKNNLFNN